MNSVASIKDRLKNKSRETGRTLQELFTLYGLERTIYRLSISRYRENFVLKGGIFLYALYGDAKVRLSFIWASENIATNAPDLYERYVPVFEKLLHDADDKVRMEAPEIFRVLGKRKPEFVRPYAELLQRISETDSNCVVRIHCAGAVKAISKTGQEL